MADRKQTPDVLGALLGGEPPASRPAPAPKAQAPAKAPAEPSTPVEAKAPARPKQSPSPRKTTRRSRAKQPQWEYMEVVFRDYGGYRPRYKDGQEQRGWKQAALIHEYLNQLGQEGWELVGVGGRHNDEMPAYFKRSKQ